MTRGHALHEIASDPAIRACSHRPRAHCHGKHRQSEARSERPPIDPRSFTIFSSTRRRVVVLAGAAAVHFVSKATQLTHARMDDVDGIRVQRIGFPKGLSTKATANASEPMHALCSSMLDTSGHSARAAEPIAGVEGAFIVPDVLSPSECARLLRLSNALGFTTGESLVEVPTDIRRNDVSLLVVHEDDAIELSSRLAGHLPTHGHNGAQRSDPGCVNRRWRVYRYNPGGACFGPHYDGAQVKSGVVDGLLVDDVPDKGVTRLSQLSVLLYLSDHTPSDGGETVFHPTGQPSAHDEAIRVQPKAGAALVFWHGAHPLSPLHEGAPLAADAARPKHVIRTDVLYSECRSFSAETWTSSNVAAAMLRGMSL